ncbi:DUF4224 domain-containing protein [Undibacterium sp. Ji83W]|uniref:DUF4224 domain-containing protein n=1 Tax=Undibacterium sp. Ji83W TaxID=3413043 RepID=UPI003BF44E64
MFLTNENLFELTGRKTKSKQIEALLQMRLPFWINAIGKPVVTVAAVEGRNEASKEKTWIMPRVKYGSKTNR